MRTGIRLGLASGLLLLLHGCGDNDGTGFSGTSGDGLAFYGGGASFGNGFAPPPPPKPPTGTLTATATAIEGAPVTFTLNFTDPDSDVLACVLDPEGDGTFQLPVACQGTVQFTYQATGTYTAQARATDDTNLTKTDPATVVITDAPAGVAVNEVLLLQAFRVPLDGAAVCVYQSPATDCTVGPTLTDAAGVVAVPMAAGTYKMKIVRDVTLTLDVEVDADNASTRFTLITPFDCGASCANVDTSATFATLQGVVRNLADSTPVAGAQVSISGGNATGGPYSTAFTDSNGEYTLTINVGGSAALIQALTNSTLRVLAPTFAEVSSQFSVTERHFSGLNFFLDPNAPAPVVLFRETFETGSPTAAGWVVAGGAGQTTWHVHAAGAGVVNSLVPTYVKLAPNDTSGAAVPDPIEGTRAFWYGSPADGSFVGAQSPGDSPNSGGTSTLAHKGTLTSPAINLSSSSGDVRLTFKTFWEVESVNPNSSGFDRLNVYMSVGGGTYDLIGRLNPLSDPAGGGSRATKPYSSIGFNAGPLWVQTETIALPGAAGSSITLRFEFDTIDGLYNGFRGWLVDDIVIEPGQGSLTAPN